MMTIRNQSGPCFSQEHQWTVTYVSMHAIMGATIEYQMMMMMIKKIDFYTKEGRCFAIYYYACHNLK